jgi:alpha-tubulin suppressor-like RCC1 family protein
VHGILTAVVVAQASCADTTGAHAIPPAPAFALTIGTAAVVLAAGDTARTSIEVTRSGDFASPITYSVSGAPAGLTTGVAGTGTPDQSTLTVTASATLVAATYTIAVTATAPGVLAQQAMLAVTVRETPGGVPTIAMVAAGGHTCALTVSGIAYCWGDNANGELGNNDTSLTNSTPVAVAGGLTFESLSLSRVEGISCGLTPSGAAYCWGENANGQLGDGTTTRRLTPTRVAGGLTFRSLAVGNAYACGIATSGTAWCWGFTANGAFGDGFVGTRLIPAPAAPGMLFQSVVAGNDFTCALTPTGAAFCWGLGASGQLGNGTVSSSATPVAVLGGLTFRSLAAGGLAVCGLTTAGTVYCWGNSFFGMVGDGTSSTEGGPSRRLAPVAVASGLTFQSIAAGYQTMCGVSESGAGYCWGYNLGAIGDGTPDHRSIPVAVQGGLTFKSISSGTGYSCGVTTTSAVYCWGSNPNGELGDGTTGTHLVPTPVVWR